MMKARTAFKLRKVVLGCKLLTKYDYIYYGAIDEVIAFVCRVITWVLSILLYCPIFVIFAPVYLVESLGKRMIRKWSDSLPENKLNRYIHFVRKIKE